MTETRPNPHGVDWQVLHRWNAKRIAAWTEELQALEVTPDRASQLRGMIYALREQNDFVQPTPKPTIKDVSYGYDA